MLPAMPCNFISTNKDGSLFPGISIHFAFIFILIIECVNGHKFTSAMASCCNQEYSCYNNNAHTCRLIFHVHGVVTSSNYQKHLLISIIMISTRFHFLIE